MLLAVAGWEFRRAAYLCRDSRPGTSTEDAVKVCQNLRSQSTSHQITWGRGLLAGS